MGDTVLLTDHKPLLGLLSEEKAMLSLVAAQIQKWAITLSVFIYSLKYRTGSQNIVMPIFLVATH